MFYLPKLCALHTWYEIVPYVKMIMHPVRQFCLGSVTETTRRSCKSGFISSVPMENILCGHFRPPQCAPPDSWVFLGQGLLVFSNFRQNKDFDVLTGRVA